MIFGFIWHEIATTASFYCSTIDCNNRLEKCIIKNIKLKLLYFKISRNEWSPRHEYVRGLAYDSTCCSSTRNLKSNIFTSIVKITVLPNSGFNRLIYVKMHCRFCFYLRGGRSKMSSSMMTTRYFNNIFLSRYLIGRFGIFILRQKAWPPSDH